MLKRFTWFKQAAYVWRGDELTIYIDPWAVTEPAPADVIFITHAHFDHFSKDDIEKIRKDKTRIFAPRDVANELTGNITAVKPGDSIDAGGVKGRTVPAYNQAPERLQFHPRANQWVGYVLTLGSHTYYHAGDTDHVPELNALKTDVAFLPIGGTYTMDPIEAAGLAKAIKPAVAVPMHYGFVVGSRQDAERFRKEAQPVKVETLKPVHPFEKA